jgi:hypothetical protein
MFGLPPPDKITKKAIRAEDNKLRTQMTFQTFKNVAPSTSQSSPDRSRTFGARDSTGGSSDGVGCADLTGGGDSAAGCVVASGDLTSGGDSTLSVRTTSLSPAPEVDSIWSVGGTADIFGGHAIVSTVCRLGVHYRFVVNVRSVLIIVRLPDRIYPYLLW